MFMIIKIVFCLTDSLFKIGAFGIISHRTKKTIFLFFILIPLAGSG